MPYVDLSLYELKHIDSKTHHDYTGLPNELILANLRKLARFGAPIRVRVPLIPGLNGNEHNLRQTAAFVVELGGAVRSVDLLRYHTLGRAKYDALGRSYLWRDFHPPGDAEVQAAAELIRSSNLIVRVVE